jgi:hypothetical protein
LKKGITTMPNHKCPNQDKITAEANKAKADLKKVTDAHPELVLDLKSVEDSLTAIARDNHRAQ